MKSTIATDEQQSERLIKCGLNPQTADMGRHEVYEPTCPPSRAGYKELRAMDYSSMELIYGKDDVVPAWSLSRLLALMPTTINKGKTIYYLDFAPYEDKGWGFGYYNADGITSVKGLTHPSDPIEASVRLIEWLLDNGYSLNDITSGKDE